MVDFAQWRNGENTELICGALVALFGLIVIGVLHAKQVKGAILIGIVAATLAGIPLGVTRLSAFDLNLVSKFRASGILHHRVHAVYLFHRKWNRYGPDLLLSVKGAFPQKMRG